MNLLALKLPVLVRPTEPWSVFCRVSDGSKNEVHRSFYEEEVMLLVKVDFFRTIEYQSEVNLIVVLANGQTVHIPSFPANAEHLLVKIV